MTESTGTTLRVRRGHNVRDPHGCHLGILDVNPDLSDPAIALAVAGPDGVQVDRPVCRVGREFDCGAGRWRAIDVHTAGDVHLDLEAVTVA